MMFIEDGTLTPESLVIDTERYSAGWSSIKSTGAELSKQIENAGWTFFYMAGEIRRGASASPISPRQIALWRT
jgi:hypothetical protein